MNFSKVLITIYSAIDTVHSSNVMNFVSNAIIVMLSIMYILY